MTTTIAILTDSPGWHGKRLARAFERLGVDVSYLETGQSWDEYAEVEAAVTRAEAAVEGHQYDEALEALAALQFSPEARELEFRALLAGARQRLAELDDALRRLDVSSGGERCALSAT